MSTVLALAQTYMQQRGGGVPSVLFASTESAVLQLRELINKVGLDIVNRRDWQGIKKRKSHTVIAGDDQGVLETLLGENPSAITVESIYNETTQRPVDGPLSDKEFNEVQAMDLLGPTHAFKIYNGRLYLLGDFSVGDVVTLFYQSRNWLATASATAGTLSRIAADTNVPIWDDELMLLGLDYFYRREKDLPYSIQLSDYERKFFDKRGEAGRVLRMHAGSGEIPSPAIVVPPSGFIQAP